MKIEKDTSKPSSITYSCYAKQSREGEHFVDECTFTYQIAGSLILNDGSKECVADEGSFRLVRRNRLLKFIKQPPENGEFKALTIYLSQETLTKYSIVHLDAGYSRNVYRKHIT